MPCFYEPNFDAVVRKSVSQSLHVGVMGSDCMRAPDVCVCVHVPDVCVPGGCVHVCMSVCVRTPMCG